MAAIFAILAIIFYVISVQEVNIGKSTMQVANIQATTFTAACAVLCGLNFIGMLILCFIEEQVNAIASLLNSKGSHDAILSQDSAGRDIVIAPDSSNIWVCPKCKTVNARSHVSCKSCGTIHA